MYNTGMAEIVHIEKLDLQGFGVGKVGDRVAHVWGALPGELVSMQPRRRRRGVVIGITEAILEPSPERITSPEIHYLSCSPWQIMSYAHEAKAKKQLVEELFQTVGISLPDFPLIQPEQAEHYRNKMEFSFASDETNRLSLAFFERAGRRKISITSCLLAKSEINEIASSITDALQTQGMSAENVKTFMLRANDQGETVAGLFLRETSLSTLDRHRLHPKLAGLSIIYSDPQSPASRVTSVLAHDGAHTITEKVLGRPFVSSLTSFFQVNIPIFEKALTAIASHIEPTNDIVDMYSGVGTIGLSLESKTLTLVETEASAIPLAKENALANNKADAQIIHAPAETALEYITAGKTIIFDPPRVGLHPKILARTIAEKPKKIVYLSCNPTTQARDLSELLKAGYTLHFFEAYNFFPRTPHIETLAILERT